jgi:hypothetical protein
LVFLLVHHEVFQATLQENEQPLQQEVKEENASTENQNVSTRNQSVVAKDTIEVFESLFFFSIKETHLSFMQPKPKSK